MYDVAVVGAGPAGAATAIHLARAGCSVVLLDRASFPRPKPCGEGLFPAGVEELAQLGVLDSLGPAGSPLAFIRFEGYGASAQASIGGSGRLGLGVRRDRLDAALVEEAARSGASVRESCTVRDLRRDEHGFRGVET